MRALYVLFALIITIFSFSSIGWSACEGDLNCDGVTDGVDLAIFANDFGTTGCGTCDDVIARIDELENRIVQLEALLQHVTRSDNDIYITGANLYIRSGSGKTSGTVNGLGNLIVGYNENTVSASRTGSHNLVLGIDHEYTSYAGLLAGRRNSISGTSSSVMGYDNEVAANYSSVTGGYGNTVSSIYSSVSGGYGNMVNAAYASISGGRDNLASGNYTSISGGRYNEASGLYASVGGGGGPTPDDGNQAFGNYSSILGGVVNIAGDPDLIDHAIGEAASVCGGFENTASGNYASVSGGSNNVASGDYSFIGGGGGTDAYNGNKAFGEYSAILGGGQNIAGDPELTDHTIGRKSTVSGGVSNTASAIYASVSGGFDNTARGRYSSVSGGYQNYALDHTSSVSGGSYTSATGPYDWKAGSCYFCDD